MAHNSEPAGSLCAELQKGESQQCFVITKTVLFWKSSTVVTMLHSSAFTQPKVFTSRMSTAFPRPVQQRSPWLQLVLVVQHASQKPRSHLKHWRRSSPFSYAAASMSCSSSSHFLVVYQMAWSRVNRVNPSLKMQFSETHSRYPLSSCQLSLGSGGQTKRNKRV